MGLDGVYVLSNLPILTFFSILFVLLLFQKSDIFRFFQNTVKTVILSCFSDSQEKSRFIIVKLS